MPVEPASEQNISRLICYGEPRLMDLVIENKITKPDEQYDQHHRNEEHRICSSWTISVPCTQVHEIQAEQSQSKNHHCEDKFLRRLIVNVAWIDEAKPTRTIDQRCIGLD